MVSIWGWHHGHPWEVPLRIGAQQLVDEEVHHGHILGQFDEEPMDNMVYSLINLVLKPNSKKWLIHDLAHPWNGKMSVNTCILDYNSKVKYHYIDELIQLALELETTTTGSQIYVDSAFCDLGVHEDDLLVLPFTLNRKIYINVSLPFGAASSCKIFEQVATLVEWIVKHHTGRWHMWHYLDDFHYSDTLLKTHNRSMHGTGFSESKAWHTKRKEGKMSSSGVGHMGQ